MAARSTNRFKQKPAVPFGDFMLPILGVIALGIIIVGIRMLWAPNSPGGTRIELPQPGTSVTVSQPRPSAEKRRENERPKVVKKEAVRDDVVAKPVVRQTAQRDQTSEQPHRVVKLQPVRTEQPPQPLVVSGGRIDNSLFIVQCGSYTESSAASSVVTSLKAIGYSAVIRRAEVRGKIYYRVIVAGGRTRSVANEIAQRVKAAGYPVLVRQNQ
ncbi:MAG: SPOR domain-containing protein [Pyramidobacter sp.]|nr:SPOR domain-containing protein [Pyramidobacter sp.]